MSGFDEFARTLERRIRREIEADLGVKTTQTFTEQNVEKEDLPRGFAWILGNSSIQTPSKDAQKQAHKAYGVRVRPPTPHVLNASQEQAYNVFRCLNVSLDPAFRRTDLLQAWRKVAKKTHPDQGGTASAFREAQAAYQILQTVFRK